MRKSFRSAFLLFVALALSGCNIIWPIETSSSGIPVTLKAAAGSFPEGGTLSFTLSIPAPYSSDLEIKLSYSDDITAPTAPERVVILADEKDVVVSFPVEPDGIYRSDARIFSVTVSGPLVTRRTFDLQIENTDPLPPVSVVSTPTLEGEDAVIHLSLPQAADSDLIFGYALSADTATPSDYGSSSGTVTIPAGETTSSFTIPLTGNTDCSDTKRFFVQITPPFGSTQGPVQIEQLILENSPANYSLNTISVVEGTSGHLTLTSDVSCPFDRTLQVSSSDGTAVGGTNYTALNAAAVTIPAGQSSAPVPVATLADGRQGPTKDFSVQVTSASFGTTAGSGTVQITDNDPTPTLRWTLASGSVARSSGEASIAWQLSAASGHTVEASVALGGSSVQGTDYEVSSLTFSISPGATSGSFPVSLLSKSLYNGSQTLTLALGSLSHANAGAVTVHTLTITDTVPTISVTGSSKVTEGATANFTVSLNKASMNTVTVNYVTQDGSALAGVDFTTTSGTLTFLSGETSATISVPTVANVTSCEANRAFSVLLSSPTEATLETSSASTSIEDDDYPTLAVADVSVSEGGTATLMAALPQACGYDVQFSWATANGTALAGKDYTARNGTLLIPAGTASRTFSVPTLDDNIDQGNRNFLVNLSSPVRLLLPPAPVAVTIHDDESAPILQFAQSSASALETVGTFSLEAVIDHPTVVAVSSSLSFSGSAVYGTDYTVSSSSITIATGGTTAILQIYPVRGSAGKTITVTLGAPNRGSVGATSSFTLTLNADPYEGPLIVAASDSSRLLYLSGVGSATPLSLGVPTTATGGLLSKPAASSPHVLDFAFTGNLARALFVTNNQRTDDFDLFSAPVGGGAVIQLNPTGWTTGRGVRKMKPVGTGQRVVFLADRVSGGATTDLYGVNADSSSLSNLVPSVTGTRTIFDFEVSPSGSKVVFLSDLQGVKEIYSVNPDGSGLVKINSSLGAGVVVDQFMITPDSSKVLFTAQGAGGMHTLYVAPVGSGGMTVLSQVVAGRTIRQIQVSPDSSRVAYLHNSTGATNFDLFAVNINGSSRTQINQNLASGGVVKSFGFSPNSAKLFYIAETQTLGAPELYIANPDGTNRYRLSGTLPVGGKISSATFTPNSSQVIYLGRQDSNAAQELYAVNLTGIVRVKLNLSPVTGGQITDYVITSDSSKVFYLGDQDVAGTAEIYSVGVNGASRVRISPTFGGGRTVDKIFLIPNQTKLIYRSNQDDGSRFDWFSLNPGGGAPTKIYAP